MELCVHHLSGTLIALVLLISVSPSNAASKRVALVIGNGAYQNVPTLTNPPRDATDVARTLERLGFAVTLAIDLTLSEMKKAANIFGVEADGADMAVIFYAGHGVEAAGENWLIPIDATIASRQNAGEEAVSMRLINSQVANARQLGLIILDACRDNPFATTASSGVPARGQSEDSSNSARVRSIAKGLVPTAPSAANVLIAFAAKDGTVASDGAGRNSPFTKALLKNLETPGLEVSSLFRKVRDEVMALTRGDQKPFVYGSLSNEQIYFVPPLVVDLPKVRRFDGIWSMHLICDAGTAAKGYTKDPVATIRDGSLSANLGTKGKPNEFNFKGTVNEFGDMQIQVTGLTDDPRATVGAPPRGTPFEFWITGQLDDTRGTGVRLEGRPCRLTLAKEKLARQSSEPLSSRR